jgi:hypothetical protein
MISLTCFHWRSNWEKGSYGPNNCLSMEIQLTKRRLRSHKPVFVRDLINKKEIMIALTVVIGDQINTKEARIPLTG